MKMLNKLNNIMKKKINNEFYKNANKIHLSYQLPHAICKINIEKNYDKIKSLKQMLIFEKMSNEKIAEMINSKNPFDKVWKSFSTPQKNTKDEMKRIVLLVKLLVIEGLINEEQTNSLVYLTFYYLTIFISLKIYYNPQNNNYDVDTLKQLVNNLQKGEYKKVIHWCDDSILDSLAYYSNKSNKTIAEVFEDGYKSLENNFLSIKNIANALGGIEYLKVIIGRILELSFINKKYSLNKIIFKSESDIVKLQEKENFYNFNLLEKINYYNEERFLLNGSNIEIALRDILKLNDILKIVSLEYKIQFYEIKVNDIVFQTNENNLDNYDVTYMKYMPYTKTGKISKNICSLNFHVPITKREINPENMFGSIVYNNKFEISEVNITILLNNNRYEISTKKTPFSLEEISFVQY